MSSHKPVRIWQERGGELSFTCSCGVINKHQKFGDIRCGFEEAEPDDRERIQELEKACMDSAMALTLAQLDARTAWGYVDMWRKKAKVEDDLRGWLRLCTDDSEGHAEFHGWASHLYFGTPPPQETP